MDEFNINEYDNGNISNVIYKTKDNTNLLLEVDTSVNNTAVFIDINNSAIMLNKSELKQLNESLQRIYEEMVE